MKARIVVRAVQNIGVCLHQLTGAIDIPAFADVVEFFDFFKARIGLHQSDQSLSWGHVGTGAGSAIRSLKAF